MIRLISALILKTVRASPAKDSLVPLMTIQVGVKTVIALPKKLLTRWLRSDSSKG
jgi:hypothetical protein